jgi:hypothetical protein
VFDIFRIAWNSDKAWTILENGFRIILLLSIGIPLITFITKQIGRYLKGRVSEQVSMLVSKGIFYGGMVLLALMLFPSSASKN